MGLNSCVAVYLLELVRRILQYKWGTVFRQEWFWRMEELTERNGRGIWLRELEKALKRFGASLELLKERIEKREGEIGKIRQDNGIQEGEKNQVLRAKRATSITEVIEEVEVIIDTHFIVFYETKSCQFLKTVIACHGSIDARLFKKTWRSLNCSPKTFKVIGEIQENILCVVRRRELITKQKTKTKCWCSKTGLPLNAKHMISCCKKVASEINARHDIVVNIILNNILAQRGWSITSRSGRKGRR